MSDTHDVIARYYAAFGAGNAAFGAGGTGFDAAALRAVLADDLAFSGPIAGDVRGADPFVAGAAGFGQTVRGITMLQQVVDESSAATLYDAELPNGTVRFAEFFEVHDGRIATLRLLYDADRYVKSGGR